MPATFCGDPPAGRAQVADARIGASIDFLRSPPGNRLEALKGDRAGQYSIRINDQWRLCFCFKQGHCHDVEMVDYH